MPLIIIKLSELDYMEVSKAMEHAGGLPINSIEYAPDTNYAGEHLLAFCRHFAFMCDELRLDEDDQD